MAQIALVNIGLHGHVNPTLGLTRELVQRGHKLVFYSTAEFASVIERTGAEFVAYHSVLGQSTAVQASAKARGDTGKAALPSTTERALEEFASTLPFLLNDFGARRPDLLINDFVSLGGFAAARHHGIPVVKFFTTYASNEHYDLIRATFAKHDFPTPEQIAQAQAVVDGICTHSGCAPMALATAFSHIEDDNLVFMPRSFQPHGETFDQRFHFVGPGLRTGDGAEAERLVPAGDGPVLLIALGSLFHEWTQFYRDAITAFGDTAWRVVMSIGSKLQLSDLGTIPSNFRVLPHIPQVDLLAVADLFISHGGMNSTMEALYHGVPLVVIPQIEEQELTAERVGELNLGRYLPRDQVSADSLAKAVRDVAADAVAAVNVAAMQQQLHAAGGAKRAADIIEAKIAGQQPELFVPVASTPSLGV